MRKVTYHTCCYYEPLRERANIDPYDMNTIASTKNGPSTIEFTKSFKIVILSNIKYFDIQQVRIFKQFILYLHISSYPFKSMLLLKIWSF
jgi:hypothetical protein